MVSLCMHTHRPCTSLDVFFNDDKFKRIYCGHNLNFASGMELTSSNVCQKEQRKREGEVREGGREGERENNLEGPRNPENCLTVLEHILFLAPLIFTIMWHNGHACP